MSVLKITPAEISSVLQPKKSPGPDGGGFGEVLRDAVGRVAEVQNEAEKAVKELVSGGDSLQAVVAMEKADMSFQTMVEVRNRLLAAYDEIMKMQV